MALNPERVNFLFNKINSSEHRNLSSVIKQLFKYLEQEIKDNPVFDQYEREKGNWLTWINEAERGNDDWVLPDSLENAKALSYAIYKTMAGRDEDYPGELASQLFLEQKIRYSVDAFNQTFLGYFGQVLEDIINANPEKATEHPKSVNGDVAFIIHGHDIELKSKVQLLMNRAGVNSIVLHEQPDKGRTIIEKLIDETGGAGYAIALLTADDITHDGYARARQNVILEIGYFLGKIGKDRIRLIVKGDVEIPSDLQGILYQKYDNEGAWAIKLIKEMQAVGIYVDIKSVLESF